MGGRGGTGKTPPTYPQSRSKRARLALPRAVRHTPYPTLKMSECGSVEHEPPDLPLDVQGWRGAGAYLPQPGRPSEAVVKPRGQRDCDEESEPCHLGLEFEIQKVPSQVRYFNSYNSNHT